MYQRTVLDNGLRVLTSTMPHTQAVSIALFVGVGSRYESDEQSGASHFIEHMLFKGTAKRPTAMDIAIAIERIGGIFNASTGQEESTYWVRVPQHHLNIAIDVLADMLRHAKFDPVDIDRERDVIIKEINLALDTPDELVHLLNNQLVWPNHPLGRDVAGTKESVTSFSRDRLLAYMENHYLPNNAVVSIAGHVEHEAAVKQVAACLGDWAKGEVAPYQPAEDGQSEPRVRVHNKNTRQAYICLSVPGLPRDHPDRLSLRLLNAVLGEGMGSRLFTGIREKQCLAYNVNSYISALYDTGVIGTYASVDPENTKTAIQAILEEWDNLRQEEIRPEELARAKDFIKGQLLLFMEDSFSVALWYGSQEILFSEILTYEEAIEAIEAITTADIQRVAQRLFLGEKLNLAVVGPFESEDRFRELLIL
ncbi:MAG TPA: insulinase family protein [Anaerolineae bacterium]|nr:insulinase family protein [Anaerolineae bacterium]